MTPSFAAVVVAAGAGTRIGADQPKGLLELAGQPLVRYAAASMLKAGATRLVVVIPEGRQDEFAAALSGLPVTALVAGGAERTQSVRNGLAALTAAGEVPAIVLITDAARPLVPIEVVERVVAAVVDGAVAVVPAVPVTDTIREVGSYGSRPLDRSGLRAVQTPQGFDRDVLLASYQKLGDEVVSDDAGVCERAGYQVAVVDGDQLSFKITHRHDLDVAEQLLSGGRP
jgi:2-C-methyl-D-erythritol 4-phosphate cytidylyltransferase